MSWRLDRALEDPRHFEFILDQPFWEYVDTDPRWDWRRRDAGPTWDEERSSDQCMAMTSYGTRCSSFVSAHTPQAPFCSRHIERAIEWFLALAGEVSLRQTKQAIDRLTENARDYMRAADAFADATRDGRTPQVYFYLLPASGLVKIGTSLNVKERAKSFARGEGCSWPEGASPEGGHVIGTIPGSTPLEKSLHRKFIGYRVAGEWFEYAPIKPVLDNMLAATEAVA